mmetsp:Transcript_22914/g.71373  ORF Transcript_22914/g.71373 Transcript_22914/m.71373 type:complete len:135 (+) Transcript_22914:49-453(+)
MASIDPSEVGLKPVEDLVTDGQTGYYGYVKAKNDLGAWVDIGCDRVGVLWRNYFQGDDWAAIEALSVGEPVLVYVLRRNPVNGRLLYTLKPSPTPRKSVAEVRGCLGEATYDGTVYHVKHESVHCPVRRSPGAC